MLAGNRLRLRFLFLSLVRNDHWTVEKFWIEGLPRMGRISPCWSSIELPRRWMAAPSPRRWTSRAAPEHLAAPRRKAFIQSFLVRGAAHGIHGASVFLSLRVGCLRASGSHEGGLHFERDRRESGLAHRAVLRARFCPRPEFSAGDSCDFRGGQHHHASICTSSALNSIGLLG